MSVDEFLALAPRERDALVAEKVMGMESHDGEFYRPSVDSYAPPGHMVLAGPRPYTTDISAAWEVVEKMEADDFWAKLTRKTETYYAGRPDIPEWHCWLRCVGAGTRGDHTAYHVSAPLAICIAALKAVGAVD